MPFPVSRSGGGPGQLLQTVCLLLGLAVGGVSSARTLQSGGGELSPAVEREWLTRRWALASGRHREAIAEALASPAWQERHQALDALSRARRVAPSLVELAAGLVGDKHPNVRGRALAVLSRNLIDGQASGFQAAPGARIPAPLLAELAGDPLPDTRLALARYLGCRASAEPGGVETDLLLELTADGDRAVRERARRELLALGPGAEAMQVALLGALMEGTGGEQPAGAARRAGVTRALLSLARAPRASYDLLARLRRFCGEPASSAGWLSLRAQFEAVIFIHRGPGSAAHLAAGWLAAEEEPRRVLVRELLVLGARAAGEPVAEALLARVVALEAAAGIAASETENGGQGSGAGAPATEEDLAASTAILMDGVLEASPPGRAVSLAVALPLTPRAASLLWDRAGLDARAWESAEVEPWLARSAPEASGPAVEDPWRDTRSAILNALAAPLVRFGHRGSGDLLARFLGDPAPSLGDAAFWALCDAPMAEEWFGELHAHWSERPRLSQLSLLELLPREPAALPFRSDMLALGASPATRTVSVVELLGRFRGDREVVLALDGYLGESLRRMEEAETAPAFRRAEGRARGALRALLAASPGQPGREPPPLNMVQRLVETLARTRVLFPPAAQVALVAEADEADEADEAAQAAQVAQVAQGNRTDRTDGAAQADREAGGLPGREDAGPSQLELPKACVAGLGQLESEQGEGLDALEALLAADGGAAESRRVRVEAQLALARAGRLAGPGTLAADYAFCDGDLRLRILRALAGCAPGASLALAGAGAQDGAGQSIPGFLQACLTDGELPLEERAVAVESLRLWAMGGLERGQLSGKDATELARALAGFLRSSHNLDLRRVVLGQLGHMSGSAELLAAFGDELAGLLVELDQGPRREAAELMWGDLLVAQALADGLAGRESLCLSRPLSRAASRLSTSFRGEALSAVTFAWRAELQAVEALAQHGKLAVALGPGERALSRIEGRLLLAMGVTAMVAEPETAVRLLAAALGALAGEGSADNSGRRGRERHSLTTMARIEALDLARVGERWAAVELFARALLHDWRRGDLERLASEEFLGSFDPVRGGDPAAYLEALAQAAAGALAAAGGSSEPVPSPPGRDG